MFLCFYKEGGFALIEILVVLVILGLILGLTIPIGINFLRTEQLDTATDEAVQTLRRAQTMAMVQENDSEYGVCFSSDSYVLIKGISCPGEAIQGFDLPGDVTASGLNEVIFNKLLGYPNVTGYIVLTNAAGIDVIDINEIGKLALVRACQGESTACLNFTDTPSCNGQDGCAWIPAYCGGTCTPCNTFTTGGGCNNQSGCDWKAGQCTGTCRSCDTYALESSCTVQSGCSWILAECSGAPVSCGVYIDQIFCELQDGCSWILP